MAVLSAKELFFRRECVFLQSVSTILQPIAATSKLTVTTLTSAQNFGLKKTHPNPKRNSCKLT